MDQRLFCGPTLVAEAHEDASLGPWGWTSGHVWMLGVLLVRWGLSNGDQLAATRRLRQVV